VSGGAWRNDRRGRFGRCCRPESPGIAILISEKGRCGQRIWMNRRIAGGVKDNKHRAAEDDRAMMAANYVSVCIKKARRASDDRGDLLSTPSLASRQWSRGAIRHTLRPSVWPMGAAR
jgi:hypothetical protein